MNILRNLSLASLSWVLACGAPAEAPELELEADVDTSAQALISNPTAIGSNWRTATTNNSVTVTLSRAVSLGQTVIVAVGAGAAGTGGTCSDSRGNTYTVDVSAGGTGGTKLLFQCSSRVTTALVSGDTITVSYPSFNGTSMASAVRVSGIATPTRLDQISSNTGTSNAPSSGLTPATTQASELVFGALHWDGAATMSAGAGLARIGTVNRGSGATRVSIGPMYRIVSATGNYAASGTLTQSSVWRAVVATYIADSTAPTVSIASVSPNPTSAGTTVSWSANEPGTFEVRVRGTSCTTGTRVAGPTAYTAGTVNTVIGGNNLNTGSNAIFVCVRDGGSNLGFASTTVTKDLSPPVVTIVGATPNPTPSDTVLSWTADQDGTYSVRVGGSSCTGGTQIASGSYTTGTQVNTPITAAQLPNTSNTVRVCVTDPASNTGSATIVVVRDTNAPLVTLVSATPNPTNAGVSVTWSANETGTYAVRVGGISCANGQGTVVETGSYGTANATVVSTVPAGNLAEGTNIVRVCVIDPQGNRGGAPVNILKDTVTPTVLVESVSPNPTAGGTTVTWSANENGTYSVRVGGTSCATGTQVTSGTYDINDGSVATPVSSGYLPNGANTLRVCLTDAAGNAGSDTDTVTRDATVPVVAVVSVAPNPSSFSGTLVTFNANEDGNYSVRVGGTSCATGTEVESGTYGTGADQAVFIGFSELSEGVNTVRICVTDLVGNTGATTTTATRDTASPTVNVVSILPSPTNAGATVVFSANESGGYSVRVGGTDCASGTQAASGAYTSPGNASAALPAASLAEGSNTVRVCVTDGAGNTGSASGSVVKDSVAPSITAISVAPNPSGSAGTTLSFTASEAGTYAVRVGSTSCADGTLLTSGPYTSGSLDVPVDAASLSEGVNTLRVCVTDAGGSAGTATTNVTKDTTGPTITVVSATPSPTANTTVAVTWRSSETGSFAVVINGSSCDDPAFTAGSYSPANSNRTTNIPASNFSPGSNTVRVCVFDALGNEGSSTTTVVRDLAGPAITIGCLAPTSGTATVSFSADEDGAYSVRVGGTDCATGTAVASGTYTGPGDAVVAVSASALSEGPNTIRVCMTDALGNVGAAVSSVVFRAPIAFDLASNSADRTFLGTQVGAEFGSMALGDLDGDGDDDLVVAERPGRNALGALLRRTAGTAYGYRGGTGFFSSASTLVPAGAAFQVVGGDVGDDLGVRNLGRLHAGVDVTGDGIGDLVISAPGGDGVANGRLDAGEVFVLSGATLSGFVDLAGDVMPAAVFSRIIGPVAGGAAQILEVRDLDGDGDGELVIGVPLASPGGRTYAGEVYVLDGGAALAGTVDLASSGAILARVEGGAAGDQLGTTAAIGDFGGTAAPDLLLGGPLAQAGGGAAYGLFGPLSPTYHLGAGDADVEWLSDQASRFGHEVGVAQVRGDGNLDVVIGARRMKLGGVAVGGLMVFEGPVVAGSNAVPNSGAYGSPESLVFGEDDDDSFGASIQLGDLDGDGYADLLVGAYRSDGSSNGRLQAGSAMVLLGGECRPAVSDVSYDPPAIEIHGPRAGGNLARFHTASGIGDLDADGRPDYCVAAQVGGTGEAYCFASPW